MDKQWFQPTGSAVGWLQARNPGTAEAVNREKATIKTLADLGFPVGRVIEGPPPQALARQGTPMPVMTGGGMWMEAIDKVESKKPKVLASPMLGAQQADAVVRKLAGKNVDLTALRDNLQTLQPRVTELCQHAGEVDLAFTREGRVVLLDVAPDPRIGTIASEEGGTAQVQRGLDQLLAAVNRRLAQGG